MATSIATNIISGHWQAYYKYARSGDPLEIATGPTPGAGTYMGLIGSRGIRQITRYDREDINTDLLGTTVIESTYIGGQMFLEFELEEANNALVKELSSPHSSTPGTPTEYEIGTPGNFDTATSTGWLTLVALAGTPAAADAATAQRDYPMVALASGFDLERMLGTRHRVIPVRLRVYPYLSGSDYVWFAES